MSGIAGGTVDASVLQEMLDHVSSGDEEHWRCELNGAGLGISAHRTDTPSVTTWDDGARAGVVYGAVTNLNEHELSTVDLFSRILERPVETAAELEGDFLIAAVDSHEDRQLLVQNKLGARPCYYTEEEPFRYATSLDPLLAGIENPRLNEQAASDMLLMGHMWGDKTLLADVRMLRPATVLEAVDGSLSTTRYWTPSYDEMDPGDEYLTELVNRYRTAIRRMQSTVDDEVGIWLSGGLDSRTTAAAFNQERSEDRPAELRAFTYDANPPTSDNPKIAAQVARALEIGLEYVPLTADLFGRHFEDVIDATDGMIRWNTCVNLAASYGMRNPSPVMMEGMQGELVGDHLLRPHLTDVSSVVESQYRSEAAQDADLVESLLTKDVDPMDTYRNESKASPMSGGREQILDIHFQNYYSRKTLASNTIMRTHLSTRSPQVDGDYLEWCSRLPLKYRKGAFPYFDMEIPYETTLAKLELIRRIDPTLSRITYERTKMKPSWPYRLHIAGFISNVALGRLRNLPTYGSGQLTDFWIRDQETEVHDRVRELVDGARERDLFDGDVVHDLYSEHLSGSNNGGILAQITTLEYWLQTRLD